MALVYYLFNFVGVSEVKSKFSLLGGVSVLNNTVDDYLSSTNNEIILSSMPADVTMYIK